MRTVIKFGTAAFLAGALTGALIIGIVWTYA